VIDSGEIAKFRAGGDRHCQRHATEGLERVNHRAEPPSGDRLVEFMVKTLEPVDGLAARPDIFLDDEWLGGGGTDDLSQDGDLRIFCSDETDVFGFVNLHAWVHEYEAK
jgi:hypothetical protein